MANKLSVAFIGTGIMGAPIAGHILDAGYPVTVNNRTKSKPSRLSSAVPFGPIRRQMPWRTPTSSYHGGLSLRGRGALCGRRPARVH